MNSCLFLLETWIYHSEKPSRIQVLLCCTVRFHDCMSLAATAGVAELVVHLKRRLQDDQ